MPIKPLSLHTLLFALLLLCAPLVRAVENYANDFVAPATLLSQSWDQTTSAQVTVMKWARQLADKGPWSVMDKNATAPSGDKHDYLSWAPYAWPNCSTVDNTTELTPEQVWTTCPYETRDGEFNPDRVLVTDNAYFQNVSDAVLYNAVAWVVSKNTPQYSQDAVRFVKTWFLDEATRMNPNLNYGQMQRGPKGQVGQHTGVLDLKGLTKIVSGLLILAQGGSPDWTPDLNTQMVAWCTAYVQWLETSPIALKEANSANNHGSFYYNQLAALKILAGDLAGAKNATDTYFGGIFQGQIAANGEQPLEANRTRPFHYRAYNLAAMITNARLAKYADPAAGTAAWNRTTASGGTIEGALAYTIKLAAGDTQGALGELLPSVAAAAAERGDPQGLYAAFLHRADPAWAREAWVLWDRPLGGTHLSAPAPTKSSGAGRRTRASGLLWAAGAAVVMLRW